MARPDPNIRSQKWGKRCDGAFGWSVIRSALEASWTGGDGRAAVTPLVVGRKRSAELIPHERTIVRDLVLIRRGLMRTRCHIPSPDELATSAVLNAAAVLGRCPSTPLSRVMTSSWFDHVAIWYDR
jgi:hypothetical protein